jgi:hypothetical protein
MNKPEIRVHNLETGEIIDRQMNDEEFAIWQEEQEQISASIGAVNQKAIDKAALLERLGITEEEASLLLS